MDVCDHFQFDSRVMDQFQDMQPLHEAVDLLMISIFLYAFQMIPIAKILMTKLVILC